MASRAANCWKKMIMGNAGAKRAFATSTAAKMKAYAPTASDFIEHKSSPVVKGEYVPVCVALGMIALSTSLGLYTAKQQLRHSPNVAVSKKRRETIPEVDDPDRVVSEADRFINTSFFRKVAHAQDLVRSGITDLTRTDPYLPSRRVDTLKSVGVVPQDHH